MIPSLFPPIILMRVIFIRMKVLKYLRVMKYKDISFLIQCTFPLPIAYFIIVVHIVELYICLKRSATLSLVIM